MLVVVFHDVLWIDRDFSAAARGIDDELRDGVAGGVAAETLDDVDAFLDAGAEVAGALDEVALVEVIRAHAAHDELVDELALGLDVVIHAAEEYGLVAHGDAGIGEAAEGVANLAGEFVWMIRMDGDEERVEFLQHCAEFRSDSLG